MIQKLCLSVKERAELVQNPLLLLDGGLGTTLEDQQGFKLSHHTSLWSSHLLITSALLSYATVLPFAIGINCTKLHKISNLIQSFEKAIETAGYSFPRLVLYPDGASHQRYDNNGSMTRVATASLKSHGKTNYPSLY